MPDRLKKYRQMRDFTDTPEPAGGKPRRGALPIFVIQKHRASHLHYDFRLEMEGVLKSWAVPKGPSYDPTVRRLAMMTEDHPYDYAAFEGVIPEGNYGAGNVIIWDEGQWEFLEPGDDPVKALASGKLTFRMFGKKMFGEWALVKIRGKSSDKGNEWLLLKHRDEFANEKVDITKVAPRSVVSDRLVEDVDTDRIWKSNRSGGSRKVLSVAETVAKSGRSSAKSAKAPAARGAKASAKTGTKASGQKRAKTPAKKKAPATSSRAASAPSRSSRAGSPTKARPTPRRPPR